MLLRLLRVMTTTASSKKTAVLQASISTEQAALTELLLLLWVHC
jgi:hypothetical protein